MDIGFVNQFNQIDLTALEDLITANEGMLAEQFVIQELLTTYQTHFSAFHLAAHTTSTFFGR